jgi:hypothetical protein
VPLVLAVAHDLIGDFDRPGFPHALNLRKRKWPAGVAILLDPVKVRRSQDFSFSSAVWTIRLGNGDRLAAARAFVRHFHFVIHFRSLLGSAVETSSGGVLCRLQRLNLWITITVHFVGDFIPNILLLL